MSSPSNRFECQWRPSGYLLAACIAAHGLALLACLLLDLTVPFKGLAMVACLAHGAWVLPRQVLLSHPDAVTGLRRDEANWYLFTARHGWFAVQLRRDSIALPGLVILRFRRSGQWYSRSVCVPGDALAADQHRRLRVRLKFNRRRWAAV